MKTEYSISFDGASEIAVAGDNETRGRIGTALLSYLSIDFTSVLLRVQRSISQEQFIAELNRLQWEFNHIHAFPGMIIRSFSENCTWQQLISLIKAMESFQRQLFSITEELFMQEDSPLSSLQRLAILCCQESSWNKIFDGLRDTVRTERRFYISEKEFHPSLCSQETLQSPCNIDSRLFFISDSLQPIYLTEVQQMAEQGVIVRKCENCGKLFLPYSGKAIYCDRIVPGTDKTCKEYAAKEKYQKKVATNEALTLYRRRSKTYSMRVLRSDSRAMCDDYQQWKIKSETALSRYYDGEISWDQLNRELALPEKKKET